ncbi:hypothetical protein [Treponema primitia]|uniref:hypothetical protein n=1 Tax=Treponema primitia TaxID=88058 RepID=UPI00030AAD9F|nr:hypothetical protein [Treponema primitia]
MLEQDSSGSLIIAATNRQNILDKALFRRFDDVLHYSLPSAKDIQKLFITKLTVYQPAFYPTNEIIEKASTLNHAEITRICTDAIKSAILTDKPIEEKLLLNLINERLLIYTDKRA